MQKLKPFILLVFYLIFSLGIGFNIHYCEQGKIEFSFFKPSEEKKECHKSCNHHNSDKDCECEDEECEYFDKDYDAVAWMELGNAKAELNWIDSPDKEKCAKYAAYMSFETPVADVKASFNVQQGSFEVEVKGIGSHFFRQWTSTLCCQGYCDLTGSSQ